MIRSKRVTEFINRVRLFQNLQEFRLEKSNALVLDSLKFVRKMNRNSFRGATGVARLPKSDKIPIIMAHCRVLFFDLAGLTPYGAPEFYLSFSLT